MKKLTAAQARQFHESGFVSPVEAFSLGKAAEYRQRFEDAERRFGPIRKDNREVRSHLLFRWASDLVREPEILDALEDLIGPDILIFTFRVWPKEPGSPSIVSWHQDHTYHMLDCDSVSAWVSLTDTTIEAGCMEVVPGSHKLGELEYEERFSENNLLFKGQTVVQDEEFFARSRFMPLRPGQMSIHHSKLVHRSGLNNSSDRRIGVAINCIPASGRCISPSDVRLTATLLRGEDRFGHFDLEPAPDTDYDEQARSVHADALRRYTEMQAKSFPKSFS